MKLAIFDMDGTLLDSMWMWRTVLTEFLESLRIPNYKEINKKVSQMWFAEATAYVAANTALGMTGEELNQKLEEYIYRIYCTRIEKKPYVKEYLEHLKKQGVKMCIATLTDRYMVEAVLTRLELMPYFDFIITVSEIGVSKQKPDIYEYCLSKTGIAKEDAVVFEDAAYCLETAHNAGFICYGIEDPWQEFPSGFKEKYCDRFITNYKDLLNEA